MNILDIARPLFRSSGDLLADRRYEYAAAYAQAGEHRAAVDLLEQVIERTPCWAAAWNALAHAREALDDCDAAISAFAEAVRLDGNDECGASLHLARLGAMAPPSRAPENYVKTLFDHYAGHFDVHLSEKLAYRAPAQLAAAVARLREGRFAHVVDLGCGTGLCGAAFRARADVMTGIDLSSRMLALANAKGGYDRLYAQSLEDFLCRADACSVDLLLAADVLIYVGDLGLVLRETRRVLRPRGLFAFTLQRAVEPAEADFKIGADLRYAHRRGYVCALAQKHGYLIRFMEEESSRREAGCDVPGLVCILQIG